MQEIYQKERNRAEGNKNAIGKETDKKVRNIPEGKKQTRGLDIKRCKK
jgi:hypothetical protein